MLPWLCECEIEYECPCAEVQVPSSHSCSSCMTMTTSEVLDTLVVFAPCNLCSLPGAPFRFRSPCCCRPVFRCSCTCPDPAHICMSRSKTVPHLLEWIVGRDRRIDCRIQALPPGTCWLPKFCLLLTSCHDAPSRPWKKEPNPRTTLPLLERFKASDGRSARRNRVCHSMCRFLKEAMDDKQKETTNLQASEAISSACHHLYKSKSQQLRNKNVF